MCCRLHQQWMWHILEHSGQRRSSSVPANRPGKQEARPADSQVHLLPLGLAGSHENLRRPVKV